MYVFVLRVESKVRLPVIVSTKKQHQEAVMSALSPTLSHRRSHCPSLCMISQCCICQWRNRKREENRFPSSFHRWLACSEWDQEKERRGLWLMRHRLAGPHLSGFGSGRERERLKCEWHFQLSTPKSLENSLSLLLSETGTSCSRRKRRLANVRCCFQFLTLDSRFIILECAALPL